MEKILPLNDYLIVQPLKEENEGSQVILPDQHRKEEFGVGEVLAVDSVIEDIVQVGDKVLFDKYLLINVKIKEDEVKFLKFSDVLGVIKKNG